jgi:hypothetical protein
LPTASSAAVLPERDDADALAVAIRLRSHWASCGFRSHDPYDGLLSTVVPTAFTRARLSRLALVQLHKRSPLNLRPLFGIPPTRSAYAAAQFASAGFVIADLTGGDEADDEAWAQLDWLRSVAIRGGWAYPFDVQTRTFHYSRATPNVVCTAFAGQAFLDAAALRSDADAMGTAERTARFVIRELRSTIGGRPYFTYLPGEPALIHNGNVLAAALVVRCGSMVGDGGLVDLGREALRTTLDAVRADGSLPYGRGPDLDWVDGHHTGFVIEGLLDVARECSDASLAATADRMAGYYRDHLFGPGGAPYPRPGQRFPVDAIAGAQGIQTFAKLGGAALATAESIASYMVGNMRLPSGTFAYQRCRWHGKRVPYARWSDGPMCLALAVLARARTAEAAA